MNETVVGRVIFNSEQQTPAARLNACLRTIHRISHDLNNVFAGIQAFAELAKEDSQGRAAEDWAEVLSGAHRGGAYLKKLLPDWFVRAWPEPGGVDLSAALLPLQQPLSGTARRVCGSEALALKVAEALFRNAAAVSITPPVLRLCERELSEPLPDGLLGAGPGRYAGIEVEDDGPGIPPQLLPQLGEPFITSSNDKTRGLGLWSAHLALRAFGGELTVGPRPGGGTLARALWPLLEEQS